MEKIKTVKKIRFTDYGKLFPTPIIVPESMLNNFLEDWNEVVLVDEVFYICISRPLVAVSYSEPQKTYKLL